MRAGGATHTSRYKHKIGAKQHASDQFSTAHLGRTRAWPAAHSGALQAAAAAPCAPRSSQAAPAAPAGGRRERRVVLPRPAAERTAPGEAWRRIAAAGRRPARSRAWVAWARPARWAAERREHTACRAENVEGHIQSHASRLPADPHTPLHPTPGRENFWRAAPLLARMLVGSVGFGLALLRGSRRCAACRRAETGSGCVAALRGNAASRRGGLGVADGHGGGGGHGGSLRILAEELGYAAGKQGYGGDQRRFLSLDFRLSRCTCRRQHECWSWRASLQASGLRRGSGNGFTASCKGAGWAACGPAEAGGLGGVCQDASGRKPRSLPAAA